MTLEFVPMVTVPVQLPILAFAALVMLVLIVKFQIVMVSMLMSQAFAIMEMVHVLRKTYAVAMPTILERSVKPLFVILFHQQTALFVVEMVLASKLTPALVKLDSLDSIANTTSVLLDTFKPLLVIFPFALA
jgi:hypothetical protein